MLTDDASIRVLNRDWRKKDRATDVLSFSQIEGPEDTNMPALRGRPRVLGDVIISLDTAARQAVEAELSLEEEVRRLLVHGILHLLGHDHVHGGAQAQRMKEEEKRLLALLEAQLGSRTPGS